MGSCFSIIYNHKCYLLVVLLVVLLVLVLVLLLVLLLVVLLYLQERDIALSHCIIMYIFGINKTFRLNMVNALHKYTYLLNLLVLQVLLYLSFLEE